MHQIAGLEIIQSQQGLQSEKPVLLTGAGKGTQYDGAGMKKFWMRVHDRQLSAVDAITAAAANSIVLAMATS